MTAQYLSYCWWSCSPPCHSTGPGYSTTDGPRWRILGEILPKGPSKELLKTEDAVFSVASKLLSDMVFFKKHKPDGYSIATE